MSNSFYSLTYHLLLNLITPFVYSLVLPLMLILKVIESYRHKNDTKTELSKGEVTGCLLVYINV